ncbi:MAG TPA: biotin synthase BioB [Nitrospiria bacterium]|nr:biotin synthase BioB [Nitrospiria bacterium]
MSRQDYEGYADKALAGECLSEAEGLAVLHAPDDGLLDLLAAAFRVRRHHWGLRVQLHVLMNAKSGLCPEDCGYCSQSAISTAPIERYPLQSREAILAEARNAAAVGARRFCVVISGRGPTDGEIESIADSVRAIKRELPLSVCCSLGLLSRPQADALKAAGVDRINHNLNTSERFYPEICSTHTYGERLETLANVRAAAIEQCCGIIAGQGETDRDLLDVAAALRTLRPESIPVNFLHPIPGTPLEGVAQLTPARCLKILCLVRFCNPAAEIRVAGGRERNLGHLQPFALYPANSIFVNGYLTTDGQPADDAIAMIRQMGFEIEPAAAHSPVASS